MPTINVFMITNVIRCILRGALIALGLQKRVVGLNILCNWVINFSMMWLLCFYFKQGLVGIFFSKFFSENFNNLMYFLLIESQDWYEISSKVQARIEKDKKDFAIKQIE